MTADSRIDDTGPASPLVLPKKLDGRGNVIENDVFPGLTKREHFAAQALIGLVSMHHGIAVDPIATARASTQYADALIAALKAGA